MRMTRSVSRLMIAPIFCRTQIRSMISGSTAALRSSVTPDARTAVRRTCSVEPVQQRAAQQDRDPAGAGVHLDLGQGGQLDARRVERELLAIRTRGDGDAVDLEQVADDLDVADARNVGQRRR